MNKLYFASIVLLSIVSCNSAFYYPDHKIHYPPEKYNIKYEEQTFKLQNGETLNALFFPSDQKPVATVVQFHGNAQNVTSHFINLQWLVKYGYNLLIFDYPGYGKSTGKARRKNIRNASVEFVDDLIKNFDVKKFGPSVILYGQSIGGIVLMETLMHLKSYEHISAIVLESTFDSYRRIAVRKFLDQWFTIPLVPLVAILVNDLGAPHGSLSTLLPEINKLVLHGTHDPVVPVFYGEHIYKELTGRKELKILDGGSHLNLYYMENGVYKKYLLDFLSKAIIQYQTPYRQ